MKQQKTIVSFTFGKAQYYVSDAIGHKVLLKIDYEHNTYELVLVTTTSEAFSREVTAVAKDLLKRKHAVNFAKRVGHID